MLSDLDESRDRRHEAKEWLIQQLEHGRVSASEIRRRAQQARISLRMLHAAKGDAKVRSIHDGKDDCWYWKLPENWIRELAGIAFPVII